MFGITPVEITSPGQTEPVLMAIFPQDPQFVDAANNDYHLLDVSPCINAGDPDFQPAAGEIDFYGNARLYAGRVDIGANEYFDDFRPLAEAGPDQLASVTAFAGMDYAGWERFI